MLEVAKDVDDKYGLKEIDILGDYLDFFWMTMHPKGPATEDIKWSFQEEVEIGKRELRRLRKLFPNAKIKFIDGNHCYRLLRYLMAKCPELYKITTVPELLTLGELGIEYHPYGKGQLVKCLNTDLFMRHQPYNQGKHCAATTAHNKGISLVFGHTHRIQQYTLVRGDGTEVSTYSLGWLGDRTQPVFDYMDTDDWGHCFGLAYQFSNDSRDWQMDMLHIRNNRLVYNGVLYEGDDGI